MKPNFTLLLGGILSLLSSDTYSQSSKEDIFQFDLRKNIQTDTGILTFFTQKENLELSPVNQFCEYFWYADEKIHTNFGGISGETLHGEFNYHNKEGKLILNGFFSSGTRNGKWTDWYESGKIKRIQNWKVGMLDGLSEEFDEKGALIKRVAYLNNRVEGRVLFYRNGKIVKQEKYNNGRLTKTKIVETEKSDTTGLLK